MADFFLNTLFGLVLLAILIVLGLCLAAIPFIMLAKVARVEKALEEVCELEHKRSETMETINRNLGQLLLHLPRMLKDANAAKGPEQK